MTYWDLTKMGHEEEEIHRSFYATGTEYQLIISTGGTGCALYWDINDKEFSAHLVRYHSSKFGGDYEDDYVYPLMSWLTMRMEKPELRYVDYFDLAYLNPNTMITAMQTALRVMDDHWRD